MAEYQLRELSLFQIENLVLTRSPFLIFRLGEVTLQQAGLLTLFKEAQLVANAEALIPYLKKNNVAPTYPLVLICQNGRSSRQAAERLEQAGFQNTYYAKGGADGLASELEL